MRGKMLNIDYSLHLLYSRAAERIIQDRLRDDYPAPRSRELWARTQRIYSAFLSDLPYLGGKQNSPQAQSVYDCIALFAYYQAVPDKPDLAKFQTMVEALFVSPYARLSPVNWNRPWVQRMGHRIFARLADRSKAHRADWPGNYHMVSLPYDPEEGVRYRFDSCPIADFARSHGYQHLMPAMCNPDYASLAPMGAILIRTTTCACGPCCDYRIVGSESPLVQAHPQYIDDDGFLRNK